jgi:formate-dependent nitrite reductase membrane component NrfD
MSTKHQNWGWMLAVDFFFAGMGGGMLVIAAVVELFGGGTRMSLLGNLLGPASMCIGCGFLILELGKPLRAWRVFMNPKAILTFGAWMMSFAITSGFVYAAMAVPLDLIFWREWAMLGKCLAVVNLITGLVVATYPGILLGRLKGRPMWVGPGMMALFMLSSLATGGALHYLCAQLMPVLGTLLAPMLIPGSALFFLSGVLVPVPDAIIWRVLPGGIAALLLLQLLLWSGYLWVKQSGATAAEAASAQRWINGNLSLAFRCFMILGTIAPLVLMLLPMQAAAALGAVLVLLGGVTMRLLTVRSGEDRTFLPGEQKYRLRLPTGNEEFLHKNWL